MLVRGVTALLNMQKVKVLVMMHHHISSCKIITNTFTCIEEVLNKTPSGIQPVNDSHSLQQPRTIHFD